MDKKGRREEKLKEECQRWADVDFFRENMNHYGEWVREIVEDEKGEEALRAGLAVFGYLSDLVNKDFSVGMEAWRVVYCGYPNLSHTDLLLPYFDVVSTRQLWVNAGDHLSRLKVPPQAQAEMTLNVYLRWYIAATEFSRQLLTFAAYCRGTHSNPVPPNVRDRLLKGGDPTSLLNGSGVADRKILGELYQPTLRHSIAHGNVVFVPPDDLVIRYSDDKRDKFYQISYSISKDPDAITKHLQKDVEPLYQAARIFFAVFLSLSTGHSKTIESHIGEVFKEELTQKIVKAIRNDPMGNRKWE